MPLRTGSVKRRGGHSPPYGERRQPGVQAGFFAAFIPDAAEALGMRGVGAAKDQAGNAA